MCTQDTIYSLACYLSKSVSNEVPDPITLRSHTEISGQTLKSLWNFTSPETGSSILDELTALESPVFTSS